MAAPLRLTVLITALTRLLLDVLTVRAPHLPGSRGHRCRTCCRTRGTDGHPARFHPHRSRPVADASGHSGVADSSPCTPPSTRSTDERAHPAAWVRPPSA